MAEKLAEQHKRECLTKENEEQRKKNEQLEQLIKEKLGGDIDELLSEKSKGPSPTIPAPILLGVQAMAVPVAGRDFLS
jgi:hypothetical protein